MDIFMTYMKQLLNFSMIIYVHVFEKEFYGVVISQTGKSPCFECSILLDKVSLFLEYFIFESFENTVDYSYKTR